MKKHRYLKALLIVLGITGFLLFLASVTDWQTPGEFFGTLAATLVLLVMVASFAGLK